MLGGNRDWIAEAKFICLDQPGLRSRRALAFVRDKNDGRRRFSYPIREMLIHWRHAGARIDEQKRDVRLRQSPFRLRLHARLEGAGNRLIQSRGIDQGKFQIVKPGLAFAPIARHARFGMDQRRTAPDQPVEQG